MYGQAVCCPRILLSQQGLCEICLVACMSMTDDNLAPTDGTLLIELSFGLSQLSLS